MKTKTRIAAELSWPQVHAFRLQRHHLAKRAPRRDLVRVAGDIGGAQAQVMSAAELQLATRTQAPVTDVRNALWRDRSLVKTWLMRGTLHLLPAEDLPLFTAAMHGPWVKPRGSWLKFFDVTEAELGNLATTIGGALNGQPMTREEIIAIAGRGQSAKVREWLKSGWGGFLKPVARAGQLCFGPSRGQSVTFVRPTEWLGAWREVEPETALAEVARRYLRAFGPATKQDFTFWFGHWPGVGTTAWSGLEAELSTISVAGQPAQILTSDLRHLPPPSRGSVQLLPAFDPYLMGHATRHHLFDAVHRSKVTRTAGWISQVVLVDGEVQGTWTHQNANKTVWFKVDPFRNLAPKVRSEIHARAEELAHAMGQTIAEVQFSWRARSS